MAHKKLKRFAEIATYPNVFQYPENMKNTWHEVFGNKNPIVLELACGKGEYTIALAEKYPERNFIGVDLKGNRLWKGATFALEHQMKNVAFLRAQIEGIATYFGKEEIEEIWITFPDPQLQLSRAKKRLTHPRFLREYQKILKPGGDIHLKTDSPDLYEFTKEVIHRYHLNLKEDINDVYAQTKTDSDLLIKTYYESLNISRSNKVFYLKFSLPETIADDDKEFYEYLREKYTNSDEK